MLCSKITRVGVGSFPANFLPSKKTESCEEYNHTFFPLSAQGTHNDPAKMELQIYHATYF
jgi:hypothetical protein